MSSATTAASIIPEEFINKVTETIVKLRKANRAPSSNITKLSKEKKVDLKQFEKTAPYIKNLKNAFKPFLDADKLKAFPATFVEQFKQQVCDTGDALLADYIKRVEEVRSAAASDEEAVKQNAIAIKASLLLKQVTAAAAENKTVLYKTNELEKVFGDSINELVFNDQGEVAVANTTIAAKDVVATIVLNRNAGLSVTFDRETFESGVFNKKAQVSEDKARIVAINDAAYALTGSAAHSKESIVGTKRVLNNIQSGNTATLSGFTSVVLRTA